MPVQGGDGTQAKCITDIYLCQEGALAEAHNGGNCGVHGVVMQAELPAWYSIVDTAAIGRRQVMYHTKFSIGLRHNTQTRCLHAQKGWLRKWTCCLPSFTTFGQIGRNILHITNSRQVIGRTMNTRYSSRMAYRETMTQPMQHKVREGVIRMTVKEPG